ncbi:hypothetical protein ACH42_16525 [Endozoicomonas sp. (ex Bugula neritina AB1)]|nr:hypothetical protein ACH42_16525 [Endozoicomonas sp. (ex Bugula neritina AB1)]
MLKTASFAVVHFGVAFTQLLSRKLYLLSRLVVLGLSITIRSGFALMLTTKTVKASLTLKLKSV